MSDRKPLSKMVRFEVFKRDKFTCQYCGGKAPEVILECDHIQPVAEGGTNDIINLVTACKPCNGGKGARRLDDQSVVERQRLQIEELEERRQQLEMMLEWRYGLTDLKEASVKAVADFICTKSEYGPNESGLQHIRRWLQRYSVEDILSAAEASFTSYLKFNKDKVDGDSWEIAFHKIANFLSIDKQALGRPWMRDIFYIQGILRKRTRNKWLNCVDYLIETHEAGVSIEELSRAAKRADSWEEFDNEASALINAGRTPA